MSQAPLSETSVSLVLDEIKHHRLPTSFIETVERFYWPLCVQLREQLNSGKCRFIGIQGTQGSGKSTCAAFVKILLESEFDLRVLVASIDDFYLTLAERQQLAVMVHPLLLTRGVPGTHDMGLLKQFLMDASLTGRFTVPRFNKASDDRAAAGDWPEYQGPYDVVILEGWCVGVTPQDDADLGVPINEFEQREDADQQWRNYVNKALSDEYSDVFKAMDELIVLQAPSFECVFQWRSLQEQKLIDTLTLDGVDTMSAMNPEQIKRFISHYQRLTEHALAVLPSRADVVLYLNEGHKITSMMGVNQ